MNPTHRDEVSQQLVAAAPIAGPHLAAGLRPAVRFATARTDDVHIPAGSSKIGGDPDLAAGAAWPTWVNKAGATRPLNFFGQVDLGAAAAAAPASLDLPTTGLLSFFADFGSGGPDEIYGLEATEQQGAVVLYSPSGASLVRQKSPGTTFTTGALAPVGAWTWPQDPPPGVDLSDAELNALDGADQAYEAALVAGLPSGWTLGGRHQLGGHARYIQNPVEEEVVTALSSIYRGGILDRARWDEVNVQVADWRVVFQLDSDNTLGLMWGDVGTLWWAAKKADAASGVWDKGMFNFQCS